MSDHVVVRTSNSGYWNTSATTSFGWSVTYRPPEPPFDEDGLAGDREPRKPKPAPPTLSMEASVEAQR